MEGEKSVIDLRFGRQAFGADPAGYHAARPDYPEWVFHELRERCGCGAGTAAFEIGAGTGIATRRLLGLGIGRLVAVEPDQRLAGFLREHNPDAALDVVVSSFEESGLKEGSFDLGVCATAFHWLKEEEALAKVVRLLRPGGWWAMVWNVFGEPGRVDDFHEATKELVGGGPSSPSRGAGDHLPFALDTSARLAAIAKNGAFDVIEHRSEPWELVLDPQQVAALYATYSNITILPDRDFVLQELERIAHTKFNGRVIRNMVTILYIARRKFTNV